MWWLNVGDFNNDKHIDIYVTTYAGVYPNETQNNFVFINNGNQGFIKSSIQDFLGIELAYPIDYNGDGLMDFIQYSNDEINRVDNNTWFEGVVNQDYVTHTVTLTTAPNLRYLDFEGDLDNDKDADYLVKDTITNEFFFLENQNGLSFQKHLITIDHFDDSIFFGYNESVTSNSIDIDKDGDLDLLAYSLDNNSVYWYKNDGTQNYTQQILDTNATSPYDISATDLDNDGDIDIIVSAYNDDELVWYQNNGNQEFTKKSISSPNPVDGPLGHFLVDIDDDGDQDIVLNEYLSHKLLWFETALCTSKSQLNLSQDQNYIYTLTPRKAAKHESELLCCRDNVIETVTYFDGLGRSKQKIGKGQSPKGNDIVSHIQYDVLGRQSQNFLPYVNSSQPSDGSFKLGNQASNINTYYQNQYPADLDGTPNPYSEKLFEASPLNRVLEQAAPGADWKVGNINTSTGQSDGHTIKFDYQNNTLDLTDDNQDNIRLFSVTLNSDFKPTLVNHKATDYYAQGELYKTITKDENWIANQSGAKVKNHTTEEFKDKHGRVVLKRAYNANTTNTSIKNTKHDTYYVYDDFGNLTYVIPPRANINNNESTRTRVLNELCYQYRYDSKNRLIRKKIPGKGWESIVYDKLDRPILTQTKNLKNKNKWLFTKYDAFGRVVYTGKYNSSENRGNLQNQADTYTETNLYEARISPTSIGDASVNYTHRSFPENNLKVLTINYYDDYTNLDLDGGTNPGEVLGIAVTNKTKSLATASQTRVLGTDQWIMTVSYYDIKARPIYTYVKNNYLNTLDITKTQLDFGGNIIRTVARHTKGTDSTIKTIDRFRYDHANRLLTHKQQINSHDEELITQNEYDELGQLINKGVGNRSLGKHLQDIDYTYNIRGWLKGINDAEQVLTDDLFAFKIKYNTITTTAVGNSRLLTKELYNGNISETIWRTANDNKKRGYGYKYDALNRIKRARYKAGENLTQEDRFFDVSGINYDKNGNIKKLNRFSPNNTFSTKLKTDELTYKYFKLSNKLKSVTDATGKNKGFKDGNIPNDDYSYDQDGNLTSDANKNITSILYNHLNLPRVIKFNNSNSKKIKYYYDALGIKLRKVVKNGSTVTTTDYANGYAYENNILQFFPTSEGYVTPEGNGFKYIYQYKDQVGNVRLSYSDADGNGTVTQSEIIEENNYYPFGLEHKGYNNVVNGTENPYKYQGKEHEQELGYNMYDFDMRHYDPAIARWVTVDPKSELMRRFSPYTFAFNNPIRFIDPDGMAPEDVIIKGTEKQAAFKELQSSVSSELTLSMDKSGKVSYTQNGTGKLSKDAQQLTSAIDDSSVTVNVNAENTTTTAAGDLYIGGAFSGNTVAKDASGNTTVTAEQEINPGVLNKASTGNGKPGADILHEVTEAYQGALISEKKGVSSPAANKSGSVYGKAHRKATSQSGQIYETLYDGAGKVLNMTPSGGYPAGVKSVQWSVKNKGKTTIIQTLK